MSPLAARRMLVGATLTSMLAGCASQDIHQTSQGFRRSQCERILEADQRAAKQYSSPAPPVDASAASLQPALG